MCKCFFHLFCEPGILSSNFQSSKTIKHLLATTPGSNNSPLFQIQCFHKWVHLTDTRLRKFLAKLLKVLNLASCCYTFHSLRHSGASLAFNLNVPMQDIQSHGTWTSEAVWAYITQDHNAAETVAQLFTPFYMSNLPTTGVWGILYSLYNFLKCQYSIICNFYI